jgi:hypothetical protein
MKKIKFYLQAATIVVLFATSCKGPTGETGPAGPSGQQGIAGAAGAAGAKGDKGEAGAANVFTSEWKTVKSEEWSTFDDDPGYFNIFFIDKNITQNLLDKGMFLCYNRITDDKAIVSQLPVSNQTAQWNYLLYNDPVDPETGVIIYLDFYDDRKTVDYSLDFRWIFIPDATLKNGRKMNIDWKNYEQVKRYLNLKD